LAQRGCGKCQPINIPAINHTIDIIILLLELKVKYYLG
jgi:hypothetical protein